MFNTTKNNNNNSTFKDAIITDDILVITCPIPRRLSLDKNWHAKEGGKEKTGRAALNLPSLTFPWSLVSPHTCHSCIMLTSWQNYAKNEPPEEEAE